MPQNYTVQSIAPSSYITSTKDDVPGDLVATTSGNVPAGATLTFSQALQPVATEVTIQGLSGLYIALPPDTESDSELVWSSEPTIWRVDVTPTGPYVIVPKDQDLYWCATGLTVQLKPGQDIKGTENEWTLKKV